MNYAPEELGVGRYTGAIGAYLAARGWQVEVVTAVPHYPDWTARTGFRNWYSVERREGARITRAPLLLRRQMRGLWRLIAPLSFAFLSAPIMLWRVLRCRPQIVLCVEPTLFALPLALLATLLGRARCVLYVQDLEIDSAFAMRHLRGLGLKRLAHLIEAGLSRRFHSVITISHKMAASLAARGIDPGSISVVRNWFDFGALGPSLAQAAYRRRLGIADGAFVMLYAGSIGAKQGLDAILEVVVHFKNDDRLMFVVAGDGPEREKLQARYGAAPNVKFLPPAPESELGDLLGVADVHVLSQTPRVGDSVFPSKLAGIIASGRRAIVMAAPGSELHDVVAGHAIIVTPGDTQSLAAAITAAMDPHAPLPSWSGIASEFDRPPCLQRIEAILLGSAGLSV